MSELPAWTEAEELHGFRLSVSGVPSIRSSRVVVAERQDDGQLVVLKYIGSLQTSRSDAYRELVEQSLAGAAAIKSKHAAFSNLLSLKWTQAGLVLVKQYLPRTRTIEKALGFAFDELLVLTIQICDALRHIHQHGSSHSDIILRNILVSDQSRGYLVDYDFAFPVRDFFRSMHSNKSLSGGSLEERQIGDVRALEGVVVTLLARNLSMQASETQAGDYARVRQGLRALKALPRTRSAGRWLNRIIESLQRM